MKIQGGVLSIFEFSLKTAVHVWSFAVPRENSFCSECPLYYFPSDSDLMGTPVLSSNEIESCVSPQMEMPFKIFKIGITLTEEKSQRNTQVEMPPFFASTPLR